MGWGRLGLVIRVGFGYGRRALFGVVVVAATCSLFVAVARTGAATAPNLSVSDASILEGVVGSRWLPFKLTLSAPATNAVTIGFTTVAGSATESLTTTGAGDYLKRSGTVTFLVGQVQKKISVLVRGDVVPEPNETFGLQLTSVVGATVRKGSGIGTILDGGSSSGFRIGIGDAAIVEGDTTNRNVVVPIALSAKAPANFAIGITTVNGTAVAGSDFVAVSKTVSVAAGQLLVAPVAVAIRPDLLVEGDKSFSISITSSVAIARSLGTVRIRDDDTAPAPATTTTSASPSPSLSGQLVTLRANVSATTALPQGTVAFMDGAAYLGGALLVNGQATLTTDDLAVGSHNLTARYDGDGTYGPSTSPILTQVVQSTTTTTQATTTTTTTTTTTPPATCSGVSVSPSANVQNVLNAYGTGTTFCFQPGTYVLTGFIVPKSYDRLISVVPRGAVFTGNDTYNAGVHGYGGSTGQHDVLFQGFVVTHMANSMSTSPNAALSAGDNWDMENNEVSYNAQIGVELNNGDVSEWQLRAPQRPLRLRRRAGRPTC